MESAQSDIVLSVAARGTLTAQTLLLDNILEFTLPSTWLVVHVSHSTSHTTYLNLRPETQRIIWNPAHLIVDKHTPGILSVHISNFALWCHSFPSRCSDRKAGHKFVLLSSNQWFLRNGVESWVREHSMSFCRGDHCTEYANWGLNPRLALPLVRCSLIPLSIPMCGQ